VATKTRQNIINRAVNLFNEKGFGAVSLFEIAGSLSMSRGNVSYHFKDKDHLLKAIAKEMWEQLGNKRNQSRQLPSFENLHNEVQLYQKFQKKYSFIFLDNQVHNHPILKKKFKKMIEQTIVDNEAAIAFAIELGNMKPEPIKGIYRNLSLSIWMVAFFWMSQKLIRGTNKQSHDVEAVMWSMLLPHFTDKGIKSFKAFFGKAYFNNLGKAFEARIENYITF